MVNKKFELTNETINFFGKKLFRIKSLIDFGGVKIGELGGFVEKEENLDIYGNAWVFGNACISGNAKVSGDAQVFEDTCVYGNACISGDACVYGNAQVCGDARVSGDAKVYGNACMSGDACVYGDAQVCGNGDYTIIKGFGTRFRTTTFFRCKDKKIRVVCGCFYGTIDQFRKQVKKTREGKIAKEYLMIADLMEEHFK